MNTTYSTHNLTFWDCSRLSSFCHLFICETIPS
jgi:hypothetical protein